MPNSVCFESAGRVLLAGVLGITLLAPATSSQASDSGPYNRNIKVEGAFTAIVVNDLDESLKWYESALGLHEVKRGRSPRVAATTVVLGGHNLFVELIHYDSPGAPRQPLDDSRPLTPGIIKVGIIKVGVIVGRREFDCLARQLHGEVLDDKEMGVRFFLVKDNEGNLVQFFTRTK